MNRSTARRWVAGIAGAELLLLLSVSGRYGYHRDELYFRVAGEHLAWGYVDQPPLTPAVARLSIALFGDSVVALRIIPAVVVALLVVVAARITRELGGDARAEVLAAATMATAGYTLGVGHLLATATFDLAAWMVLLWIGVRLLRTGERRLWLAFGAIAGLALLNKNLVVLLAIAFVVALALERRWDLVRSPWLVAGGVLALAIALPNLVWQADHDWPQVEMAQAIEDRIGGENRVTLLPGQLVLLGPLGAVLVVLGVRDLLRRPALRGFRALLWAWLIALALTFVSGGRPYYPLGFAIVVMLAAIAGGRPRRFGWPLAANVVFVVPAALPLLPVDAVADYPPAALNETTAETVGWEELVDTVARAVQQLPAEERERVVLLAASYGEAGALERFGPDRGLPLPYSGHNSYASFRRPSDDGAPVLALRYEPEDLSSYFRSCRVVTRFDNAHDIDNEVRDTPLVHCRGLRGTWAEVWERLRRYS